MPDILERLLITLAVRLHAFGYCEIEKGWRLSFRAREEVTLHYVLAGSGILESPDRVAVAFEPNSIIIVPARTAQLLGEAGASEGMAAGEDNATLIDDGLIRFTAGNVSRDVLTICGSISVTYGGGLGLFDHLREPLVESLACSNIVRQIFEMLIDELASPTVGTQVLTESLMKQCLVLFLRRQLLRSDLVSPFFAALQDRQLAQAVTAVLEQPAATHTVKSLAAIAGMSRSTFAERFALAYDLAPLEFVRRVRLRHAATLLVTTAIPVKVIASSIGYTSRSYFTRAFKAAYGMGPKAFRSRPRSVEPDSLSAREISLVKRR
jgi:AraC family transcriptional regulator, activator of mtrCDE